MKRSLVVLLVLVAPDVRAEGPAAGRRAVVTLDRPMSPPTWALLQRQLLRDNAVACREFFDKYFDDRGWLLCVERWGGDDGPDDAIENCTDWPILHSLGAHDDVLRLYKKAWEGHLRQFTLARTTHVPFAKEGMYYKEFPVMFDWLHNGEGLAVFNLQGLSDPDDARFRDRTRRFAGFYLNEDPDAPNYDSKHKIIRSMFNGSKGPLLRKATGLDWAGDPIEIGHRFKPRHGERTYEEMVAHFKDYNDTVGDHPQNLLATVLAANAFMLEHEPKYKEWLLEYVDAWLARMKANGGIIPSNVGLDGKIGSTAGGKWYGGVYGWGFSVFMAHSGKVFHRNNSYFGLTGFMNAYLLTGDDKYLESWRRQIDLINSKQKNVDGKPHYPHMHGDEGWYLYTPEKFSHGALELYLLGLKPDDRRRLDNNPWLDYLDGKNPGYAEQALRRDLERIRQRVDGMRKDPTTPDTRLADDPMPFNPASVESLIELALGGVPPRNRGKLLFSQLRYFDPARRRAGLPQDVAALIDRLGADELAVTLVNTSAIAARTVVVQAGGYGEHRFVDATVQGRITPVGGAHVTVRLAPGCGGRIVFKTQRFVNAPTLAMPI